MRSGLVDRGEVWLRVFSTFDDHSKCNPPVENYMLSSPSVCCCTYQPICHSDGRESTAPVIGGCHIRILFETLVCF